jgi:hypothetical protein
MYHSIWAGRATTASGFRFSNNTLIFRTEMLRYSPLSDYAFHYLSMAASDPKVRQQQLTYLAQLGADSDFTLDTDAATKAEFTRLAVDFLGWVSYSLVQ